LPVTKEKAGADGTAARQHKGTAVPACTTTHLQHLPGSFPRVWPLKRQGEEVVATALVISSLGTRLTRPGRGGRGRNLDHLGTEVGFDLAGVKEAEGHDSLWSDGEGNGGGAIAPYGGSGTRRSSPNSNSDGEGDS
jgi:hypothetical protein